MAESELTEIIGDIYYLLPVEDGDPLSASFFQGFAPSLLENVEVVRLINSLPSDIWELTPEGKQVRLARRMSGQAPVRWHGQSPHILTQMNIPIYAPFTVLFIGRGHNFDAYSNWINSHSFPLTVVGEFDGCIQYDRFDVAALQSSFLKICDALVGLVDGDSLDRATQFIKNWGPIKIRQAGRKFGGHYSIGPNLTALSSAGFDDLVYGEFKDTDRGVEPYVEQIVETTKLILGERDRIGERAANQHFRRPPSLNLFAPAIYPHIRDITTVDLPLSVQDRKTFIQVMRGLNRQEGYAFELKSETQARAMLGAEFREKPIHHPLIRIRASEVKFATECVGTIAASEISATIRLPNAVNRSAGLVRQFAELYHSPKTTDRKK